MTDLTTQAAERSTTTKQIACLRALRQIRQLKPEPVPQAALDDILEVARWTGSARNIQPWDLIVIQDRQTLETLGTSKVGADHTWPTPAPASPW